MSSTQDMVYVGALGEPSTLAGIVQARAERTPDTRFVVFEGSSPTYAEQLERAERAAAGLAAAGVTAGTKVALMLPNCLEFLDLWFGSALLGAVLVPLNTGLKGEGLRYIATHSDADVAVVDAPLVDTFQAAVPADDGPSRRFVRGDLDAPAGWAPVGDLLHGGADRVPRAAVAPGALASVLYTSGTTGLPKGVMNCHNAYGVAAHEFTRNYVRVRADDVFYTSLPLFHVNAQMLTTVGSLVSGRPMVLAPRFSASRFFDDVCAHGATVFNYIGAMLTMLFKQPERDEDGDHRVRLAVGGAAPTELWPAFEQRFGLEILEIYGLTETATFCIGSPPDAIRVGKLGQPVSWSHVQVQRADGTEAAPGEAGEIMIRAKQPDTLFRGYYKNDDATAKAMASGWFASGDRGRRDGDGYFVFIDRMKDAIRRRGENISSYEVERAVSSHPAVAESAAVGVPADLGEEEVMAVVVPQEGAHLDPADLVAFCEERIATFMVPRYVLVRDELPKTATQRVQKFVLRAAGVAGAWDRLEPAEAAATDNEARAAGTPYGGDT